MIKSLLGSPLARLAIKYGLIAGVLCSGFVVSMYYMGSHPLLINPFFDFRIPVFGILIFFMLKEVRDFHYNGELSFGQGMLGGFMFTIVCAILCWGVLFGFCSLENRFVTAFVEQAMVQARTFSEADIQRIGKETYEEGLRELQRADAGFMSLRYGGQCFIISFFVTIIISVICRRHPAI